MDEEYNINFWARTGTPFWTLGDSSHSNWDSACQKVGGNDNCRDGDRNGRSVSGSFRVHWEGVREASLLVSWDKNGPAGAGNKAANGGMEG